VNRDHPVGEDQDDKDEDGECEIAQKVHGGQLLSVKSKEFLLARLFDPLDFHTQRQLPIGLKSYQRSEHQIRLILFDITAEFRKEARL
jgi:hypothetical protein